MRSAKSIGRTIGVLLFLQLVGLVVPFILILPIATPGFLSEAAEIAFRIRMAVMLLFANGALTIGISIVAFRILREYSVDSALLLLAASVVWFAMQGVDNAHILSMLSLSQQYTAAGGATPELFDALGTAVRSTRRWAHLHRAAGGRRLVLPVQLGPVPFALVPRALPAFGLAMSIVHTTAITLPMFLAYGSVPPLGFSLALSHLAVGAWLVARGFEEPRVTARGI
jgi:Domain of unknown function (DUF4386)